MSKASLWRLLLPGCYGSGHKQRSKKQMPIQRLSFSDVSSSTGVLSPEDLSISLVGSNLYVFTLAELKEATQSFSVGNFLGEGGFGPVYRGFVDDKVKPGLKSQPVAVKLLDLDGGQGHKEWLVSAAISMASSPFPHVLLHELMLLASCGSSTGRSACSWTTAASPPREVDWVLLRGGTPAAGVRVHASGQLGEPSLQKYVHFLLNKVSISLSQ